MNCSESEYLAPLYRSHELDAQSMAELETHMSVCAECARELQMQGQFDQLLKDTFADQGFDTQQLRAHVLGEMRKSTGLWHRIFGTPVRRQLSAVAILLVLVLAVLFYVSREPTYDHTVYTDAADDHAQEVVNRYQDIEWNTALPQIQAMVEKAVGDPSLVNTLAPAGYRIDRARICELVTSLYVHLVYTDGQHQVSIFLRKRSEEILGGKAVTAVNGKQLHEEPVDKLQVAGFQSLHLTVLVVTDQARSEAVKFATQAAEKMAI